MANKNEKQIVFTAGSGRSGTTSLMTFIKDNIKDCTALHEPSFQSPTVTKLYRLFSIPRKISGMDARGFNQAINWCDNDDPMYERLTAFRAKKINKSEGLIYFEANHAFLTSLWKGMVKEFPQLKVIHLVRPPLEVASSFNNKILANTLTYDEAVQRFRRWNVTPELKNNVLPAPDLNKPTLFQLYVWAWIELELRYERFRCQFPRIPIFEMRLDSLSDREVLSDLMLFLGQTAKKSQIKLPGVNNANKKDTIVSTENYLQAKELLQSIPYHYLELLPNPYNLLDICSDRCQD